MTQNTNTAEKFAYPSEPPPSRLALVNPPAVFKLTIAQESLEFTGDELSCLASHDCSDQQVLVNILFNDQGITRTDVTRSENGDVLLIVALVDTACRSMLLKHVVHSPVFVI